ncbi:uncharacterized protein LOC110714345 [Chenopodium quinoa]|uniref:uncharacterized protein LOC110714345 n=1 Tax=Chenopodium quinoa TaxID=63459 RepID=UPI000B779D53|nr:uncharacterized protein LOC110714345 [Chenopodium quinoa]
MQGVIKINSDASVPKSSNVGLGGIMRDALGEVVAAMCLRVDGQFGADIAEALAMRHALCIAIESGFRRVCVETDCLKLHSYVSKGNAPPTEFGSIVHDILHIAKGCQSCSFTFVKRSGNRVAHELAKLALSFDSLRVWLEEVPGCIAEFVLADLSPLSN